MLAFAGIAVWGIGQNDGRMKGDSRRRGVRTELRKTN